MKKAYEIGILTKNTTIKDKEDDVGQACLKCCIKIAKNTHRQSPIDIIENTAKFQEFRPFTFLGYENLSISSGNLIAKNTGGTLKLLAEPGIAFLEGGPLNVAYEFVEMHFHWGNDMDDNSGSEHKFNGKSYPLELHMVHKNIHDESIDAALGHENGLCVLAFLFDIVECDLSIPGLDSLMKLVTQHLTDANSIFDRKSLESSPKESANDVNIANFLPFLIEEYFTYRGSLTTGGCEEAVNWVVFRNQLAARREHLSAFQSLKNEEKEPIVNNYRATMSANGRPIYYHGDELLALDIVSMGKKVGLRSVDPAPTVSKTVSIVSTEKKKIAEFEKRMKS